MNKFGLTDRTINELIEYFSSKPDIEKVIIFGSRAKNTHKVGSDIDFAIITDNHEYFHRISDELEQLPTPYKFDVIDYKTITQENILKSIDQYGQIFYQK